MPAALLDELNPRANDFRREPASQTGSSDYDVAIVGGGFSGTMVAVGLRRLGVPALRIAMFDRTGAFGRGAAYSAPSAHCLLNVPAKAMGAIPDDETDFVRWLERTGAAGDDPHLGERFVARRLYGEYLRDLLDRASASGRSIALERESIVDIVPAESGYRLLGAGGRSIAARAVVLAIGNLPPSGFTDVALPQDMAAASLDPWRLLAGEPLDRGADVLVVGTGLTALDVMLHLAADGHRGKIVMFSRRGRFPLPHATASGAAPASAPVLRGSPHDVVRSVRRLLREWTAAGCTWQQAIDAIRPQGSSIWQAWTPAQRRQFVRHVSSIWQVHRHRAPASTLSMRDRLIEQGVVSVLTGRIISLARDAHGVRARYIPRGESGEASIRADVLVNCTGPRRDYRRSGDVLVERLLERDLARTDPLALGFSADHDGTLGGFAHAPLYALGTPLRGTLYECSAVKEIRAQAATIAASVLGRLGETALASRAQ